MIKFLIFSFWLSQALWSCNFNLTTIPVINPVAETMIQNLTENADADDPAIYINAQNPAASLVIATFKQGGLGVYDLTGREIQYIVPQNIRYNNVDLLYGVKFPSQIIGEKNLVDLAIASDRQNDTIAIFQINPYGYQSVQAAVNNETSCQKLLAPQELNHDLNPCPSPLQKITSIQMPTSIFGIDDGEATAYGLAAYTSIAEDKNYVFVSQSDGNQVAQLELKPELGAADELVVRAEIVDIFTLPIPPGLELEDALIEGMVVDPESEILYLAQENRGIWQAKASPHGERQFNLIDQVAAYQPNSPLSADIEGLALYSSKANQKYLIVSSQGDSTFAVYDLLNNHAYITSFTIAQVSKTDGLDVTDINLEKKYPAGLLVVQDGENQDKPNFKFISMADVINTIMNVQ